MGTDSELKRLEKQRIKQQAKAAPLALFLAGLIFSVFLGVSVNIIYGHLFKGRIINEIIIITATLLAFIYLAWEAQKNIFSPLDRIEKAQKELRKNKK